MQTLAFESSGEGRLHKPSSRVSNNKSYHIGKIKALKPQRRTFFIWAHQRRYLRRGSLYSWLGEKLSRWTESGLWERAKKPPLVLIFHFTHLLKQMQNHLSHFLQPLRGKTYHLREKLNNWFAYWISVKDEFLISPISLPGSQFG